tara:strand:- start:73 stop:267 length:195 start_codon:yes stop_codon:yes gene_type:complete
MATPSQDKDGKFVLCKTCKGMTRVVFGSYTGYIRIHFKASQGRVCKRMKAAIEAGHTKNVRGNK